MSAISLIRDDMFNNLVSVFDNYDNIFSGKSYTKRFIGSSNKKFDDLYTYNEIIYFQLNKPISELSFAIFFDLQEKVKELTDFHNICIILSEHGIDYLEKYHPNLYNKSTGYFNDYAILKSYDSEIAEFYNENDLTFIIETYNNANPKLTSYEFDLEPRIFSEVENKNILKVLMEINEIGVKIDENIMKDFDNDSDILPLLKQMKIFENKINEINRFYLHAQAKIQPILNFNIKKQVLSLNADLYAYGIKKMNIMDRDNMSDIKSGQLKLNSYVKLHETLYNYQESCDKFNITLNYDNADAIPNSYECYILLKDYFVDIINFDYMYKFNLIFGNNTLKLATNIIANETDSTAFFIDEENNVLGYISKDAIINEEKLLNKFNKLLLLYNDLATTVSIIK